jgi:hypothetical protein
LEVFAAIGYQEINPYGQDKKIAKKCPGKKEGRGGQYDGQRISSGIERKEGGEGSP